MQGCLLPEIIYQECGLLLWNLGGTDSINCSLKDPCMKTMNNPSHSPRPEPHRTSKGLRPPSTKFLQHQYKESPSLGRNCSLGLWGNGPWGITTKLPPPEVALCHVPGTHSIFPPFRTLCLSTPSTGRSSCEPSQL